MLKIPKSTPPPKLVNLHHGIIIIIILSRNPNELKSFSRSLSLTTRFTSLTVVFV